MSKLVEIVLVILTLAGFYYWIWVWTPPEYQEYLDKKKEEMDGEND
jgi:hypothetical protein